MTSRLSFANIAELRNEKVIPSTVPSSRYVGLEHIEQNSLLLSGWGNAGDVDSQKQKFLKGDILFGKLRPYFRKVVVAPFDGICSTDIWVVKPIISTDRDFVFYWMASDEFINRATNASEGTKMPRAKWDWVSGFELPYMSVKNRQRVGQVLRALDEKIIQNQNLSQTLEEIAQTIFKSWFIDFDPVKAKMAGEKPEGMNDATATLFPNSMEESEIGLIPNGWTVSTLGGIASISKSTINPQNHPDVEFKHYSIPDFDRQQHPSTAMGLEILSNKFLLTTSAVLLSKLNPETKRIWTVMRPENSSICSTEFIVLIPKNEVLLPFVDSLTRYSAFYERFISLATGSTGSRQRVRPEEIQSIAVVIPSSGLLEKFAELARPCLEQQSVLGEEIQTLLEARDLLLPRLISGELQIPEEMLVS